MDDGRRDETGHGVCIPDIYVGEGPGRHTVKIDGSVALVSGILTEEPFGNLNMKQVSMLPPFATCSGLQATNTSIQ